MHAFHGQPFGVQRARGLHLVDRAIHQRLGECRFVGLVMAVAAIADDVQHDVGGEAHAELGRHAGAEHHRLGIVAVHVQDRHLDRFRHIGAVEAGIGVRGNRGEADLVVHHQMHGAAGAVADELAHRQRLVHQPLAGERRVAVHQDRHHRACAAACRPPGPAARAPCRSPPDRPPQDATGWAVATGARCGPRYPDRSTCRDGTSRRPTPAHRPA